MGLGIFMYHFDDYGDSVLQILTISRVAQTMTKDMPDDALTLHAAMEHEPIGEGVRKVSGESHYYLLRWLAMMPLSLVLRNLLPIDGF